MNSIQLPRGLEAFNDSQLTEAREATAHLTAADLRNIGEPTTFELRDGRETFYYSYPLEGAEGTIFFYQAVNQNMTPQAMAQVYAMQALLNRSVVVFPQNSIGFNRAERKQIRRGDFSPYGEIRLQGIEHALGSGAVGGEITIAGYSFGATDAAASGAAIAKHKSLEVTAAVLAEPANITKRNIGRLALDLFSTSSKDLIHAVQAADFPALTELYKIAPSGKSSAYLRRDFLKFAKNFLKIGNGNGNASLGLTKPEFASDVIGMFDAMANNGLVFLHEDLDSKITPEGALDQQYREIETANIISNRRTIALRKLRTTTLDKQGHALGDNPWAWASIIRSALEAQKEL